MTKTEKWDYLLELDETLLVGGVMLSEWTTFLIRNADLSFVGDANLSCIITSLAGIETYLRSEEESKRTNLYDLIEQTSLDIDLKAELHSLRII